MDDNTYTSRPLRDYLIQKYQDDGMTRDGAESLAASAEKELIGNLFVPLTREAQVAQYLLDHGHYVPEDLRPYLDVES